jgi:hypothetical protein
MKAYPLLPKTVCIAASITVYLYSLKEKPTRNGVRPPCIFLKKTTGGLTPFSLGMEGAFMQLKFLGGAGTVTGSRYRLSEDRHRLLLGAHRG